MKACRRLTVRLVRVFRLPRCHHARPAHCVIPLPTEQKLFFSVGRVSHWQDDMTSSKRNTIIGRNPAKKHMAYVALGSNLGDRVGWIEKACSEMDGQAIRVKRTSSLWETEPMYVKEQDRFINGVCEVETRLEPLALLNALQDIERKLGRQKTIEKGPRNIDLDIVLYDDQKITHPRLQVPHAGMSEREFVLRPLAELILDQILDPSSSWKLIQDYLDDLPPSQPPLTNLSILSNHHAPLQPLSRTRKTHVMAILNLTPDSFSDGGVHASAAQDPDVLLRTVDGFLSAGATVIDVGGQSTRPGAPEVSPEEEVSRVLPAISLIRQHFGDTPILSIDTYRASVAEAAVRAGAHLVNDVSAGVMDPQMLPTVARLGCAICLMHMRGTPATMNSLAIYDKDDLLGGIARELMARVAAAEKAGIRRWRIMLDPGLGFAKRGRQNVVVLRRLEELRNWPGLKGLPWLVGPSRKSFVGEVIGRIGKANERDWGTAGAVSAAVAGGADVVRLHRVVGMADVVRMADAVWREG